MNPVFELNALHVSLQSHHQEIELVRGVSFAVAPGECLGILGESGSGKSMSMKAAQLPCQGQCTVSGGRASGQECRGAAPSARRKGGHHSSEPDDLL